MPKSLEQLDVNDVFPLFDGWEDPALKPEHITMLKLSYDIGAPYPAEVTHKSYAGWWHALHEIGHFAVKPEWYLDLAEATYPEELTRRIGSIAVPKIEHVTEGVTIEALQIYTAGNDVIPRIGMLRDPTLSEEAVRIWSLQVIEALDLTHPSDELDSMGARTGNTSYHQESSARVWLRYQAKDPARLEQMEFWGINPLEGKFRPTRNTDFEPPHPKPEYFEDIIENIEAVHDTFSPEVKISAAELSEWREFLEHRFAHLPRR